MASVTWASACGDGGTGLPPPDPPRPTTVTVSPAAAELTALGATVQLQAEVRDQNGQAMTGAVVSWSSSTATVTTVGASGLVTAVGNGTATITATAGPVSGTATVTVAQRVNTVNVAPMRDTLVQADTLRLSAGATDVNGHPVAGAVFTWGSSDTLVAVVEDSGVVIGIGPGEAEITAVSSGVPGRARITVVAPAPTTVAVTPDTVELTALGESAQLAAEVTDQVGRVMEGVAVSWSSADTLIAPVDSAGVVTAVGNGTTRITAAAGRAAGNVVVTVVQLAGSIVVSPSADTVGPGDTLRLAAEAFDENGHSVAGAEFAWSSSDTAVATVDASGLVNGLKEGVASITATMGDTRGTSEITVENPDRAALVALFHATEGPKWLRRDNWVTDAPLSEWYGVEIGPSGRVVVLEMYGNGLTGPLPPELGKLTSLESLYLPRNALTGAIPLELGNLASLRTLDLSVNALTGQIPSELGRLIHLRELSLGSNDLTGPIPPEVGNLTSLSGLYLGRNRFTGPIPPQLGNLLNLRELTLRANAFTGPIPSELGNLVNLTALTLWGNRLTGPIPPELGNLVNLTELNVNGLDGAIPPELGNLASLRTLRLFGQGEGRELTGPMPPELGNLTSLKRLDLSNNALTGRIPPQLGNLRHLDTLSLSFNALAAPIPPELGDLTGLGVMDLAYNGLTGPVPPELGNLARLEMMDLAGNSLTGPIPPELANLANLKWLSFEGNNALTGGIPSVLGSLSNLETLNLEANDLTGPIPPELGSLASLKRLELFDNNLAGPIPPELGNLANLETLGLSHNSLTGSIPLELGRLGRLEELYLQHNLLTGAIPPELGNLASLRRLRLHSNDLYGPIPPEFAKLKSVTVNGLILLGGNDLCFLPDPKLRVWLTERGVYPFPCLSDPDLRLLPRALMREDGNGLSLALPDDLHDPSAITVSNPSVVAASVSDGWLELTPLGRGSAEVEVVPSSGGTPAIAEVVVRAAIGTFGIDIVMDQPAPLNYEETVTAAADWWSSILDGTEWTDSRQLGSDCGTRLATALADELLIWASASDFDAPRLMSVTSCFRRSEEPPGHDPAGGSVEVNTAFSNAGDVGWMRHAIGHFLGLVLWPPYTGLVDDHNQYFLGPLAVATFRAGGGDPSLPGVPMEPVGHWHSGHVAGELMARPGGGDAVSLAALADAGYTVDLSKATPWRKSANARAEGTVPGVLAIEHIVVKWVGGKKPRP